MLSRRGVRAGRWIALGVLVAVGLVLSVPVVAHLSLSMPVERLAEVIASRRAAFVAQPAPARDGERQCETASVLALFSLRHSGEEEPRAALADAVDAALECRRAWNVDPTSAWFAPRVATGSLVAEYLALSRSAEPELRLERAVRALRLADRLMSVGGWRECDAASAGADELARVAHAVGAGARAAAIADVAPLALEPRSPWLVLEGTALAQAEFIHEDVEWRSAPSVLWRPSVLRVALVLERTAYETLALAEATRGQVEDKALHRLAPAGSGAHGPVALAGPVPDAADGVICTRRAMRAALLVLDPERVTDPRLADPVTGEPLRLSRAPSGAVSVTWGGEHEPTTTIPSAPGEGEVDRMLRALVRGDEDPPIAYADEGR